MTKLFASKLDMYLDQLNRNVPKQEAEKNIMDKFNISIHDVGLMFQYLKDNGYVTGLFDNEPKITMKGQDWISDSNNGFTGNLLREKKQSNRLEDLESHQKRHRNQLFWLTLILAVSGFVSAWYYLTELCKYYHWHYFFCNCGC